MSGSVGSPTLRRPKLVLIIFAAVSRNWPRVRNAPAVGLAALTATQTLRNGSIELKSQFRTKWALRRVRKLSLKLVYACQVLVEDSPVGADAECYVVASELVF